MRPPAISLWRPYPAMIFGKAGKDVENRTWTTRHRGDLLIHAAQRWEPDALPFAHQIATLDVASPILLDDVADNADAHPTGIIGVAELYDVCDASKTSPADRCGCSPWAIPGHHHWQLRRAVAFPEPVKHSGKQGMWAVRNESWQDVFAQLKAVGRTPGRDR